MKKTLPLTVLMISCMLIPHRARTQCTFTATLTSTTGNCLGTALHVNTANPLSQIVWYNGSAPVQTVNTVTCTGSIVAGGNGLGTSSNQFNFPCGVFLDAAGNLYVADVGNSRIQKFAPGATTGVTVAGLNGEGPGLDQLDFPRGIFVDAGGNIYIADVNNQRIVKWAPGATQGIVVAGGNGVGTGLDQLDNPTSVFVDASGNIYIADQYNFRVMKWAPGATQGIVVAGGNGSGSAPNQIGLAINSFVDAAGNVYVSDQNNHEITKWAPGATQGIVVAGGNGNGSAANQLYDPNAVFVDASGNIYVADYINNRVQEWTPGATQGITVAGGAAGAPGSPVLGRPNGLYVDAAGNIYVSSTGDNSIQKWTPQYSPPSPDYTPTTDGSYTALLTDNNGCTATTNAILVNPIAHPSVSIDSYFGTCGDLFFQATPTDGGTAPSYQWKANGTDIGDNSDKLTVMNQPPNTFITCVMTSNAACAVPQQVISNSVGLSQSTRPVISFTSTGSLCPGNATLHVISDQNIQDIIWYNGSQPVAKAGHAEFVTGTTVAGGHGSGTGANQINTPTSVGLDAGGYIYVAEYSNNRVTKWTQNAPTGVTVAGGNGAGSGADQLSSPFGIFVAADGTLYIADRNNYRIQKWAPGATSGVTVAGGHGSGSNANQMDPVQVYVDGAGNIYVTDQLNNRVQKWAPGATSGVTVAGGHGAGAAANQLDSPFGLAVDASGNVYVSDQNNNRVQKWTPGATSGITVAGGNGAGAAANQLNSPEGISVDGYGNLFIADLRNQRIQEWVLDATAGITVAGGNGAGSAQTQFNNPYSVCLDASGFLFVADATNFRIQEWRLGSAIPDYTPKTPGSYTAVVISRALCQLTTDPIVIADPVAPAVSISAASTVACPGQPLVFTATPVNGGAAPLYQWQINGINTGANSSSNTFDAGTLASGGILTCVMTSNATVCLTQQTASSSPVTVTVNTPVTPSVTILNQDPDACPGTPVTLTAMPVDAGTAPIIQWTLNGVSVGTNSLQYTSSGLANGDQVSCSITANAACMTSPTAQSNTEIISIKAGPSPTLTIQSSDPGPCSGQPIHFTAVATNEGASPQYQWQINGSPAGTNSPDYTSSTLTDGTIISCLMTTGNTCGTVQSNKITQAVKPAPSVVSGQIFPISAGESAELDPLIQGDIDTYLWSPATGLSDPAIRNPVATPTANTVYTLTLTGTDGCAASGTITVKIFTQLKIPNAFTPNGDGHNDIFYIKGGPIGSLIREFNIFDRWGQKVFGVQHAPTEDPAYGWNGNLKGGPAPAGTYVYVLFMNFADGSQQVFKGTVLLIR